MYSAQGQAKDTVCPCQLMHRGQVLDVILLRHAIRLSGHLSFLTSRGGIGCSPSHPLQVSCDHWSPSQGLLHAKGDSSGSAWDGSPEELGTRLQRCRGSHTGEEQSWGTGFKSWRWLLPAEWKVLPSLHAFPTWEVEIRTKPST